MAGLDHGTTPRAKVSTAMALNSTVSAMGKRPLTGPGEGVIVIAVSAMRVLLVTLLIGLAGTSGAEVVSGSGVGAIPDGNSGNFPNYGPPRVISFTVSGVAAPISSVALDIKLTHTSAGDLDMVLKAPGGAPSLSLVSLVGWTSTPAVGDNSNFSGEYGFSDAAAGGNIWTAAGGPCGTGCDILAGSYRSTGAGGPGQTNPPPVTSLNATFGGLTPGIANGTWTLEIRDAALLNVGTVNGARLFIDTPLTDVVFDDGFEATPCTEGDAGCPTAIELERLRQAVIGRLEAGTCIPSGQVGGSPASLNYCHTNSGGCSPGCRLTSQVPAIEAAAVGPGRATVDLVFDVSGMIRASGGLCGSCTLNAAAAQQRLRTEVVYAFDAGSGQYTVTSETRSMAPAFDNWQFSNCGVISCFGTLVDDMFAEVSGQLQIRMIPAVGLEF